MQHLELRRELIARCLEMNASGINQGTSGNLSARVAEGMLITPSGVPYHSLQPEDLVLVEPDGRYAHPLEPSTEWRFHSDLYRARPDVGAVVHAHPVYCTTLAVRRLPIPAVHYMIAVAGGADIRCARYETYGTPELSQAVMEALQDRHACLLANHGMIATGPHLAKALWLAVEVEHLARLYVQSLQIGGPVLLSEEEIARVLEKFRSYGLKSRRDQR